MGQDEENFNWAAEIGGFVAMVILIFVNVILFYGAVGALQ